MTYGEAGSNGRAAVWEAVFWLLFVVDLCVMQYLSALTLITPFALGVGGLLVLRAWLLILFFQAIYAAGLIYACLLRKRRPLMMIALLVATPIIAYGGWYLVTKAGLVPPVLGPVLS
ncbi:MAG: hypothetical protein WAW96_08945 [Alphaproteobacteria bacterium]